VLTVFAANLAWCVALIGLGSTGREENDEARFARAGFRGFMVLAVTGTVVNFFLPVTPALSAAAAALGIALFVRRGRLLLAGLTRFDLGVFAVLLAALSAVASREVLLYDSGLYHLQAVKWIASSPVPLGLANLHRRLGLNSSWFPAAAMMELPGFEGRGSALIATSSALLFATGPLLALRAVARGARAGSAVFLAVSGVIVAVAGADLSIPSLSTDLPVSLITILVLFHLMRCLEGDDALRPEVFLLAVFAFTIKLSAAPLAVAGAVAVLLTGPFEPRLLVRTEPLVLVGSWLARGLALSGCLLYPAAIGRLEGLPWSVPLSLARAEILWARSWARLPGGKPEAALNGWNWLGAWTRANLVRPAALPLLALAAGGLILLILGRGRNPASMVYRAPAAVAAVCVVFWFWMAPDLRFAYGSLLSLSAMLFCSGVLRVGFAGWPVECRRRWSAVFAAAVLAAAGVGQTLQTSFRGTELSLVAPGPPRVPTVVSRRTEEGVEVFGPKEGNQCWSAPLPCTPILWPGLKMDPGPGGLPRLLWYERSYLEPVE
jgi:hypothetical protein